MSIHAPGRPLKAALFVVFTCSGFSGLVYESIWSHYLKLMLGHAAYAQTLVLSIFMGGMAVGAWLASRHSNRLAMPLLAYAAAELAVGFIALGFHPVFTAVLDGLYLRWLPALGSPFWAGGLKWTAGALLILPQSVLLGTTFPLMGAGFIRLFPATPGAGLGLLYFANSLGAAVGVLVSVFVLIPWVGLPGAVMSAGLINVLLALAVWMLAKGLDAPPALAAEAAAQPGAQRLLKPILAIALGSSLASFCYEIGWIRLLSLVLGSSTQAFELMLGAFILGLAFGGWWIRGRLDRIASPLRYAGHVQILMGVLALGTLPLYLSMFNFMGFLLQSLSKSDGGYALFNFGSQAIALAVMLPATFAAGMTLPLFTYALLRGGEGERGIGRVYSANTVGAILGVLLAVHVLIPVVGVKGVVAAGALLDIGLGLALLALARPALWRWEMPAAAGLAALVCLAVLGVRFDPLVMASGVYRYGSSHLAAGTRALDYRDGKTASVALTQDKQGRAIIITNGKPDASIQMLEGQPPSMDEVTMVMLGALPLALHPQAKSAAVVGFGSGLTTHTLLGAKTLERVDTIEIEPAMVEAAKGFAPFNRRAYEDPRSHIHIDDAKAYFSSHNARYDVIASEPSNPWVSGVAGLFSEEFYRHVKTHLQPDGVLVQWLQLYEIDLPLLSSVFQALSKHFAHYAVFNAADADIVVVASNGRSLDQLDGGIFTQPGLRAGLARVEIDAPADLRARRIGGAGLLQPLFAASGAPANSDYFPYLSLNAPKARYLNKDLFELTRLHFLGVPVLEMLDPGRGEFAAVPAAFSQFPKRPQTAAQVLDFLMSDGPTGVTFDFPIQFIKTELLGNPARPPADKLAQLALFQLASTVTPYLPATRILPLWDRLARAPGYPQLSAPTHDWLALYRAVAARDGKAMGEAAWQIIDRQARDTRTEQQNEYLLAAALTGYLAAGEPGKAMEVLRLCQQRQSLPPALSLQLNLLAQLAIARSRAAGA